MTNEFTLSNESWFNSYGRIQHSLLQPIKHRRQGKHLIMGNIKFDDG